MLTPAAWGLMFVLRRVTIFLTSCCLLLQEVYQLDPSSFTPVTVLGKQARTIMATSTFLLLSSLLVGQVASFSLPKTTRAFSPLKMSQSQSQSQYPQQNPFASVNAQDVVSAPYADAHTTVYVTEATAPRNQRQHYQPQQQQARGGRRPGFDEYTSAHFLPSKPRGFPSAADGSHTSSYYQSPQRNPQDVSGAGPNSNAHSSPPWASNQQRFSAPRWSPGRSSSNMNQYQQQRDPNDPREAYGTPSFFSEFNTALAPSNSQQGQRRHHQQYQHQQGPPPRWSPNTRSSQSQYQQQPDPNDPNVAHGSRSFFSEFNTKSSPLNRGGYQQQQQQQRQANGGPHSRGGPQRGFNQPNSPDVSGSDGSAYYEQYTTVYRNPSSFQPRN